MSRADSTVSGLSTLTSNDTGLPSLATAVSVGVPTIQLQRSRRERAACESKSNDGRFIHVDRNGGHVDGVFRLEDNFAFVIIQTRLRRSGRPDPLRHAGQVDCDLSTTHVGHRQRNSLPVMDGNHIQPVTIELNRQTAAVEVTPEIEVMCDGGRLEIFDRAVTFAVGLSA